MQENELKPSPTRHPFINLVLILLFVGLGFVFVGPMIGFFAALPFYEGTMMDMITDVQDAANHPELKIPLYIIQGFATLVGLILAPAAFMVGNRTSITTFFKNQNTQLIPVIITAFVVIV